MGLWRLVARAQVLGMWLAIKGPCGVTRCVAVERRIVTNQMSRQHSATHNVTYGTQLACSCKHSDHNPRSSMVYTSITKILLGSLSNLEFHVEYQTSPNIPSLQIFVRLYFNIIILTSCKQEWVHHPKKLKFKGTHYFYNFVILGTITIHM